jgi:two-component system copper resistance phosphate regulon response regulator CusR
MKALAKLRILVIEDDSRMLEFLRTGLRQGGHSVVIAKGPEQGRRIVDHGGFDAIVLRGDLPGQNGFAALAQQLQERPDGPAILTLAPSRDGLNAGADGSLNGPFSLPELLARLDSAVRRIRTPAPDHMSFGPFHLDIGKRRLTCDHGPIQITRSEYLLLRALVMHRGETVPRRQLVQAVWGTTTISHGTLDTLVNTLRGKLNLRQPWLIATMGGAGYALVEDATLRPASTAEPRHRAAKRLRPIPAPLNP